MPRSDQTGSWLIDIHALFTAPVLRANLATIGLGWALFSSSCSCHGSP
jgi:hypothetical protein